MDVRAVRQRHEGGKLAPSERRATGAELDLIDGEFSKARLEHAVHAVVLRGELQAGESFERRGRQRPDGFGVVLALRGEISFGKNFERVATRFFGGQTGDALFQFGKAGQASKQSLLDKRGCLGMSHRYHCGKISNLFA